MNESATRREAVLEFNLARKQAWLRYMSRRLTGKCTHLCVFNLTTLPITERIDRGTQTVEMAKIVGSMGRANDFDADFRPRVDYLRDRWVAIHIAYTHGEYLPPVSLIKFGDHYYVLDGHHRISVMRYHGQEYIEASVIELITPCWN